MSKDALTPTLPDANTREALTTAGRDHSYRHAGPRSGLTLLQPNASPWTQSYGYDAAGNLALRTNNFAAAQPLVQTFSITNPLNQLTSVTRTGKLTVAGTTTTNATSVTVNGEEASWYGDATFAKDGFTLTNGVNSFTAVAQDGFGRLDTNTVAVDLPATVSFTYDDNGNLLSDGRRLFGYDDENQLITVIVTNGVNNSTLSKFAYDGFGRRRMRTECVWQNGGWATNAPGTVRVRRDARAPGTGREQPADGHVHPGS